MEAPKTPAQMWAAFAGGFLLVLGVLSLIIVGLEFNTVNNLSGEQNEFVIWQVSGWLTLLWILTGALGLFAMSRIDAARTWSLVTGVLFVVMAVWGFIDGNDVASIFAAGTTDNITHAVLGVVGLLVGMLPESKQRDAGVGDDDPREREVRFERERVAPTAPRTRETAGTVTDDRRPGDDRRL